MVALPSELSKLDQWTHSYSEDELKRPKHYHYKPNGGLSLEQVLDVVARSNGKLNMGFYTTYEDPYILGDIDKVPDVNDFFGDIPPNLAFLLASKPTYMEVSPSGSGVRFIYKFSSVEEKQQFTGNYYLTNELQGPEQRKNLQINVGTPWMRMTGNALEISRDSVAVVDVTDLEPCFELKFKVTNIEDKQAVKIDSPLPARSEVESVLKDLPLDQNPRIERAFKSTFGSTYQHYDYWLKVMMAVHYYGHQTDNLPYCYDIFVKWSQTDPTAYDGTDEIDKHWRSLDRTNDGSVTIHTLFSLGYYNTIIWPRPKKQSQAQRDANVPLEPVITEYENFEKVINFYNIKFVACELEQHKYYLTGDEDIMEKYFSILGVSKHFGKYYGPFTEKIFKKIFSIFLQKHDFRSIGHRQTREFIQNAILESKQTINFLKYYIDTPFDSLPDEYQDNRDNYSNSSLEELFNCLNIEFLLPENRREEELALYKKYYRAWIMGIVRSLYYEGDYKKNSGMLLFSGKEKTYKSTHFDVLLPRFFRRFKANTTHGFQYESSMTALAKLASQFVIITWDDKIDRYLNEDTEVNFKSLVENDPQVFIDKFEVATSSSDPKAIYGGTSNSRSFNLSDNGSRRIFHIPIGGDIDIDKINKLCWHPILNELKTMMFEGIKEGRTLPWNLTEEEINLQLELTYMIKRKNSIDDALEEIYAFENEFQVTSDGGLKRTNTFRKDESGTFKTLHQVKWDLQKYGIDTRKLKNIALKNALRRFCGNYTKTSRITKHIKHPACSIKDGLAVQNGRKAWVMPPLRYDNTGEEITIDYDKFT